MATDIPEICEALQYEEITTLEAIYPDQVASCESQSPIGRILDLRLPITLPSETQVDLKPAFTSKRPIASVDQGSSSASSSNIAGLVVTHLPGASVRVSLPQDYPIHSAPTVQAIRATIDDESSSAGWLSRRVLAQIADKLPRLWEEERMASAAGDGDVEAEGVGILWRWWEWVAGGECLQELGLLMGDRLSLTIPPSMSSSTFFTLLSRYNAKQIHASFESTAFACAICFESRKGKKCAQMPCGCVFCYGCLHSCWTLAISEGTLEAVSCPDPGCVKKRATGAVNTLASEQDVVDAALVESVVGKAMRERWEELKDRRRAEIDPTYCICPRPGCQAPVPPPKPSTPQSNLASSGSGSVRPIRLADLSKSSTSSTATSASEAQTTSDSQSLAADDRWDRYRQCPTCSYSFCLYCSATWHGAHAPCSFPQTSALVVEYLSYPEDSPERLRMEQRRGKKNIDRMVAKYLEEEENKKWLDERTRACAGCGVRVEKSHGCNHMTCGRCGAHFCYRCGVSIKPADPYEHYRRPGSSCFEKLFDQEEIARFERETAMQHAGMGGQLFGDEWGPRGVWEW